MTSIPVPVRDRLARIYDIANNAVQMLKEAAKLWVHTGQELWHSPRFSHKGTGVVMILVALLGVLCIAYVLLVLLPFIVLGVLGVVFVRAVGRKSIT